MKPNEPPVMARLFKLARRLQVTSGACEVATLVAGMRAQGDTTPPDAIETLVLKLPHLVWHGEDKRWFTCGDRDGSRLERQAIMIVDVAARSVPIEVIYEGLVRAARKVSALPPAEVVASLLDAGSQVSRRADEYVLTRGYIGNPLQDASPVVQRIILNGGAMARADVGPIHDTVFGPMAAGRPTYTQRRFSEARVRSALARDPCLIEVTPKVYVVRGRRVGRTVLDRALNRADAVAPATFGVFAVRIERLETKRKITTMRLRHGEISAWSGGRYRWMRGGYEACDVIDDGDAVTLVFRGQAWGELFKQPSSRFALFDRDTRTMDVVDAAPAGAIRVTETIGWVGNTCPPSSGAIQATETSE